MVQPPSAPAPPPAVEAGRLFDHVTYLASPELAGRAANEPGGVLARRYLAERFADYGLQPWQTETSFEHEFPAGVNVIGVLPGGDPGLAEEFVVLGAHYDHLGASGDRGYFPGAADNAAGVAVLLETARVMAASPDRPARAVVFAAFDAEEIGLYGSFVFTGRDDFDATRFAGLVNLDMLGRPTFDARDNTLLAVGTRRYPGLRAALIAAGNNAGIDVLPVGRELVGPRSDHVSFEPLDRPWVFLTCGPFMDYHTPADTIEQLDFSALERSAKVVGDAVWALADAPAIETPTEPTAGDLAELDAVIELTARIAEVAPPQFTPAVQALHDQTRLWRDAGDYSPAQNQFMHQTINLGLTPMIFGRMLSFEEIGWVMQRRKRYVEHTDAWVADHRDRMRWRWEDAASETDAHSGHE